MENDNQSSTHIDGLDIDILADIGDLSGEANTAATTADAIEVEKELGFAAFGLSPEIIKAIKDMGYAKPTPVQDACIPRLLESKTDLLALAKTGTGKTAAFGLPLVERVTTEKKLQALVLCPTRELASQVSQNLQAYGTRKGLKVVTILGGESYRRQIDALRNNPQILVSTPGRLVDLMDQKVVKLEGVEYFILDEADEMLSFGFQDALESVWEQLSKNDFNTWLFSATMSDSIRRLASKYLKTPFEVTLNRSVEPIRVENFAAVVYEEDKEDALSLLIQSEPNFYGIVFAQTKQQVANLEVRFRAMGFNVDSLHGDKVQAERTRTINRMKKKEIQILVATDVAARGLDIEDLTHVVNFELPWDVETYTHRIGRTARAGKEGTVWTFVRPKESQFLRKFERALKFEFKSLRIPTVEDVRSSQIRRWLLDVTKAKVGRKDQDLYELSFNELPSDEMGEMFPETKEWLIKAMSIMKIGMIEDLKQPRSFELRPRENQDRRPNFSGGDRRSSGGGGRSFGGDRRSSGGGGRSFGGDRRSTGDRDRGSFGGDRRSFSGERSSAEGAGERRPFTGERRSFDRPRNDRQDNRPDNRSEGGGERRPFTGGDRRSFGGERRSAEGAGERRSFSGERSSFGGGERRPFTGERSSFGGGERRPFTGDRRPSFSQTTIDSHSESKSTERKPRKGSARNESGKWV